MPPSENAISVTLPKVVARRDALHERRAQLSCTFASNHKDSCRIVSYDGPAHSPLDWLQALMEERMQNLNGKLSHRGFLAATSYSASILSVLGGLRQSRENHLPHHDAEGQCCEESPRTKVSSALHLLVLAACLVVQTGGPDLSGTQGIRRALQTMESRSESSQKGVQSRGAIDDVARSK